MATILLIEDDAAIRELLKIQMLKDGHHVLEAENGHVGLDMAQKHLPDLIVLDVNMPVMDGVQVIRALDAAPQTRVIPVIALTAMHQTQIRDDMYTLGCLAYVTKPLDLERIRQKVAELTSP